MTPIVASAPPRHDSTASEGLFRSAFANAPIGMAVCTLRGRFLEVNAAFCLMVGYAPHELVTMDLVGLSHHDHRKDASRRVDAIGRGEIDSYVIDKRYLHRAGHEVWVQVRGNVVAVEQGPDHLILQITDITERRRYEALLAYQAEHDSLTGLPNRAAVLDRLQRVLDGTDGLDTALLFCDLDRFKAINDSLGHHVGDQILVQLGVRLRSAIRPDDVVGRLGGDEFVVVCCDLSDRRQAVAISERIAELLDEPFLVDGVPYTLSTSIGIAFAGDLAVRPVDDTSPDAHRLLRNADAAMYRAKDNGRSRSEVFDQRHHHHLIERARTERDLRQAVERGEMRLLYQPVVSLLDGTVVGVEALVRWEHPERGLLGPADFIPLAEESGLIVPVGTWVIEEACRQMHTWRRAGLATNSTKMAVNVSGRQLASGGVTTAVARALAHCGLRSDVLQLEVTESMLIEDDRQAGRVLAELRALGVGLAIDDFGTGYSALTHLKRFPFDTLKIDRSFVDGVSHDVGDQAIVAAVVGMAQALGLWVVAEGVEDIDQVHALRRHGVGLAQGYLFSPPLGPTEAGETLGQLLLR